MDHINNSLYLMSNMLGHLFADIICPQKRTVFREHSSRKTVNFEEQIMYPRTLPRFSWEIFGHVTCLDQPCASENIWLIIINT